MCDITQLIGFGSSALGVAGNLYRGFSGSSAHRMSAEIARGNTEILLKNAETEGLKGDFALQKSAFESSRLLSQVERVIGGQTAHFAANNLDPSTGSPLLLAGFTAAQGEIDAGLIRARGMLEAADAQARVASTIGKASTSAFTEIAELEKSTAALISGMFGAGTALLTGATKWAGLNAGADAAKTTGAAYDASADPFLLNFDAGLR
jgi:hypothetical protein